MTHSPAAPRARSRARTSALAVGALALGVLGVGAVSDSSGWRTEMAETADLVAGRATPLGPPVSQGNALCLDVCRGVTVEYRTDTAAPETIAEVRARLEAAGFEDIDDDCSRNVWCQVRGTRDGLAVYASQYEEDAPYGLAERRILSVHVGEAE